MTLFMLYHGMSIKTFMRGFKAIIEGSVQVMQNEKCACL